MGRFFTLQEAETLLPRVEDLLRVAISAKTEADEHEAAIQKVVERITTSGGVEIDPAAFAEKKSLRMRAYRQAKEALETIQGMGVLVKDLETGLIDFPALYEGEEVYLCWKLGEPGIEWWHRVEDGFAGRRPIGPEFRASGDPNGSGLPN